jgi:hypothetical protein
VGIAADSVNDILAHHGIPGPWEALTITGVANHIYATSDVVLRIATDHPEAVEDARTESVAAPIARAAGVLVPRPRLFWCENVGDLSVSFGEADLLRLAQHFDDCFAVFRDLDFESALLQRRDECLHDREGPTALRTRNPDIERRRPFPPLRAWWRLPERLRAAD